MLNHCLFFFHLRNVSSRFKIESTEEMLQNHFKWIGNLWFGILEFSSKVNNIPLVSFTILSVVKMFNFFKERSFVFVSISCLTLSSRGLFNTRGFMTWDGMGPSCTLLDPKFLTNSRTTVAFLHKICNYITI